VIETKSMIPSRDAVSETLTFLQTIYGVSIGCAYTWLLQDKTTLWHTLNELPKMSREAVKLGQTQDIYFPVCPQVKALSEKERGTLASVQSMNCVWTDMDCQGGNHKQTNFPPSKRFGNG